MIMTFIMQGHCKNKKVMITIKYFCQKVLLQWQYDTINTSVKEAIKVDIFFLSIPIAKVQKLNPNKPSMKKS